jgi:hypothetical protein
VPGSCSPCVVSQLIYKNVSHLSTFPQSQMFVSTEEVLHYHEATTCPIK